tara:strand:+ start:43 stop:948 length:906 start_codon:yes stop_codon:yes gene_type:complete
MLYVFILKQRLLLNISKIILFNPSMNHLKFKSFIILVGLTVFSCGGKSSETEASPDEYIEKILAEQTTPEISNVNLNINDIIDELNMEIKALQAELDYQQKNMSKIEAEAQLWANPFSVYNKEIVLNNGSSIFGKIIYQDHDVMKVETLIGQLIIDRSTIVRVVNQLNEYNKFSDETPEISGNNLINKKIQSQSAHLVLIGDILEEKDASGNTVLIGEVKNVGNKRADFSKIIFTFRMNWHGETKSLTTFINGVTNTFNTGISSDNSILPHAVGNFELIIPKSFGIFIGYNYDIDWSQYDE